MDGKLCVRGGIPSDEDGQAVALPRGVLADGSSVRGQLGIHKVLGRRLRLGSAGSDERGGEVEEMGWGWGGRGRAKGVRGKKVSFDDDGASAFQEAKTRELKDEKSLQSDDRRRCRCPGEGGFTWAL